MSLPLPQLDEVRAAVTQALLENEDLLALLAPPDDHRSEPGGGGLPSRRAWLGPSHRPYVGVGEVLARYGSGGCAGKPGRQSMSAAGSEGANLAHRVSGKAQ